MNTVQNQFSFTLNDVANLLETKLDQKFDTKFAASEARMKVYLVEEIDKRMEARIDDLCEIINKSFTRVERRIDGLEESLEIVKVDLAETKSDVEEIKKDRLGNRVAYVEKVSSRHVEYFTGLKKTLQTA